MVYIYIYILDINNNPIIIIDTQGFEDTRGKNYDDLIYKAFEDIFSNLIIHINVIFFIGKSIKSRLTTLIKYIFILLLIFIKILYYRYSLKKYDIKSTSNFINSISNIIKYFYIKKKHG